MKKPPITLRDISDAVSERFEVTTDELHGQDRHDRIVLPRQVAFLLARDYTCLTFSGISKFFGNRDHGTAMHGCRKAAVRMSLDPKLERAVEALREDLESRFDVQHRNGNGR